jgi:hypothetical protein
MEWGTFIAAISAAGAAAAAIYAAKMATSNQLAVKAAAFDERWKIYKITRRFIAGWLTTGRPDMKVEIFELGDAWEKSLFLFRPHVSDFLEQVMKDAYIADDLAKIANDESSTTEQIAFAWDQHQAIKAKLSFERVFEIFDPDLNIRHRRWIGIYPVN